MTQTLYILCISGMITMLLSGYIIGEKLTRMSISKSLEQAIRGLETMDKKIFKLSDHIGKVGDEWRKKAIDEIYADMPPPKKETAYASNEQMEDELNKETDEFLKRNYVKHSISTQAIVSWKNQDVPENHVSKPQSIYEIAMELGYKKQFMDAVPWQDVFLHQWPHLAMLYKSPEFIVVEKSELIRWEKSIFEKNYKNHISRYFHEFQKEQRLQYEDRKPIEEKLMDVEVEPAPEPTLNEYLDNVAPENIHNREHIQYCIEPGCPREPVSNNYCEHHLPF